MPYAQIQTQALRHPKIVGLSDRAFRAWVAGLAYCQEHLTDGLIPDSALVALGVKIPPKIAQELVENRLWIRKKTGYEIHDYLAWNRSRDTVESRKSFANRRKRQWLSTRSERVAERVPERVPNASITLTAVRSTQKDQDQEHRPAGRDPEDWPWPVRRRSRSPPDSQPSWAHYVRLAHIVLDARQPGDLSTDDVEAFKATCASAGFAYDSELAGKALDAAEAVRLRQARRR